MSISNILDSAAIGFSERRVLKQTILKTLAKLTGSSAELEPDTEIDSIISGNIPVNDRLDAKALQNRDRSRQGYITQMQKIAANPDYDLLSTSKTPNVGAPMVFARGVSVPRSQIGRPETITMSDGKSGKVKIKAVYAVVDADDLIASHDANGNKVETYGGEKGLMALNNGRTAALKLAFSKGTANKYQDNLYKEALKADADSHGVAPQVIDALKRPVLVRLFAESALKGIEDPGAASNETVGAELSDSEQAETDAKKLQSSTLAQYEGGSLTSTANADFVRSLMNDLGQGTERMRTEDGALSASGMKRIQGALVAKAYGDNTILKDLTDDSDSDLKSLGDVLIDIAGRWAVMKEAAQQGDVEPSLDITKNLVEAIHLIRKARQDGKRIIELVNQTDIFSGQTDPMTEALLRLMFRGDEMNRIRSADKIKQALHGFITKAMSTPAGADMFGFKPSASELIEQQKAQVEAEENAPKAQKGLFDGLFTESKIGAGARLMLSQDSLVSFRQDDYDDGLQTLTTELKFGTFEEVRDWDVNTNKFEAYEKLKDEGAFSNKLDEYLYILEHSTQKHWKRLLPKKLLDSILEYFDSAILDSTAPDEVQGLLTQLDTQGATLSLLARRELKRGIWQVISNFVPRTATVDQSDITFSTDVALPSDIPPEVIEEQAAVIQPLTNALERTQEVMDALEQAKAIQAQEQPNEQGLKRLAVPDVPSVESYRELMKLLLEQQGKVDVSDVKALFNQFVANGDAVKALLNKSTKKALLEYVDSRYKSQPKEEIVEAIYNDLVSNFAYLDGDQILSYSWGEDRIAVVKARVDKLTQEQLETYAQKRIAAREERKAQILKIKNAIANPITLEDFELRQQYAPKEPLTPEQQALYDALKAGKTLEARQEASEQAREDKGIIEGAKSAVGYELAQTTHAKKNILLYVVRLTGERLEREAFDELSRKAKQVGGYYSSYRGQGAIPGFQFTSEEDRAKFTQVLDGATVDNTDKVLERESQKDDSRITRLLELAQRLEDKSNEELSRDRLTNTARRAGMAAGIEERARKQLAFAQTLRNIAEKARKGEVQYIAEISHATQLETLMNKLNGGIYVYGRKQSGGMGYGERQDLYYRLESGDLSASELDEVMQGIDYPRPALYPDDMFKLVQKMKGKKGYARTVQELERLRRGSIERDSMVVIPLSVAEKVAEFRAENKNGVGPNAVYEGWQVDDVIADIKRLTRMGIETPEHLRMALRELISLKEKKQEADPLKELERSLIGKHKDLEWFNTPDTAAKRVVMMADLSPNHKILEPSAGLGHLADAAVSLGIPKGAIDCIELSTELAKGLTLKGYPNVEQRDFLTYNKGGYDRIIMNPPFSGDKDIEHVLHAFKLLKAGGRLVAIVSGMTGDRQNTKNQSFRAFLDEHGIDEEALPEGTFKASINSTGVNTKIIVLEKKASLSTVDRANAEELALPFWFVPNSIDNQPAKAIQGLSEDEFKAELAKLQSQRNSEVRGLYLEAKRYGVADESIQMILSTGEVSERLRLEIEGKRMNTDQQALESDSDEVDSAETPSEPVNFDPEFIPTHALSADGVEVVAHPEDEGVWIDAYGNEYEGEVVPLTDNGNPKPMPPANEPLLIVEYLDSPNGGKNFGRIHPQAVEMSQVKDWAIRIRSPISEVDFKVDTNQVAALLKSQYILYRHPNDDAIYRVFCITESESVVKYLVVDLKESDQGNFYEAFKARLIRSDSDAMMAYGSYPLVWHAATSIKQETLDQWEKENKDAADKNNAALEQSLKDAKIRSDAAKDLAIKQSIDKIIGELESGLLHGDNSKERVTAELNRHKKLQKELQDTGRFDREFDQRNGRRNGPALAAQGARDAQEVITKLEIYLAAKYPEAKVLMEKLTPITFDKPYSPQTLMSKTSIYNTRGRESNYYSTLSLNQLAELWAWVKLTNALWRYSQYRYYDWSSSDEKALMQTGGQDHINELKTFLEKQGTYEAIDNNYQINFGAIKQWIDKKSTSALEGSTAKQDETLDVTAIDAKAPPEPAPAIELSSGHGDALDETSDNYRFADTGYIAGSKKELAAQRIKLAKARGELVRVKDIDWGSLEENAREADAMITKSNLLGKPDWEDLKAKGMTPQAAWLIDKVYRSIGQKPPVDTPEARKAFVMGLETIRDRLEACKTPQQIADLLSNDITAEMNAATLTAEEAEEYYKIRETLSQLTRRFNSSYNSMSEDERTQLQAEQQALRIRRDAITEAVIKRNKESLEYKAWHALGDRFEKVVKHKYSNTGSKAFFDAVHEAKKGKPDNWDWAIKDKSEETDSSSDKPKEPKEPKKPKFQLVVSDRYERVGGRAIKADSTLALKNAFGLRDVQSGNYVLKDQASAEFHVQRCAEAFADLADIIGVDDQRISIGGRLAMAFGARGSGNALAHYESVQRVINMTKMKGGGSLAHEWFHAFDNMLIEYIGEGAGKTGGFVSDNPASALNPIVRKAFEDLRAAMEGGNERESVTIAITEQDRSLAKRNLEGRRGLSEFFNSIQSAKSLQEAMDYFMSTPTARRSKKKELETWIRLICAYHAEEGKTTATFLKGEPKSKFLQDARRLDGARDNAYWSTALEMAARAFSAYVEDKLREQGRKNDYLSNHSSNSIPDYVSADARPFPEGEERKRTNAAFDALFKSLRENQIFDSLMSMAA